MYDEVVKNLFLALDRCEELFARSRYIVGDVFIEVDV